MARIFRSRSSSFISAGCTWALLVLSLLHDRGVTANHAIKKDGSSDSDLEDRLGMEYDYVPNYADRLCDSFVTYETTDGHVAAVFDPKGASVLSGGTATESCCGDGPYNDAAKTMRQSCGPEFWPFTDVAGAFHRCQPKNKKIVRSLSQHNNQQTPINFQISDVYGNLQTPFVDISRVPKTYPANAGIRGPTGFSFSDPNDQEFVFTRNECPATVSMLKGTWQVDFTASGCKQTVQIGGKRFSLKQFHLHSAEHTVNAMFFPIEVHLVHLEINADGTEDNTKPLVIGAFMTVSNSRNNFFTHMLKAVEDNKPFQTNPYRFLAPSVDSYWHYLGSLTTPPCQLSDTGYVRWFVLKRPITMSYAQAQFFTGYFNTLHKSYNGNNNRPIQELLPSTVVYSKGPNPATFR